MLYASKTYRLSSKNLATSPTTPSTLPPPPPPSGKPALSVLSNIGAAEFSSTIYTALVITSYKNKIQ
jgi:hypothetical protein